MCHDARIRKVASRKFCQREFCIILPDRREMPTSIPSDLGSASTVTVCSFTRPQSLKLARPERLYGSYRNNITSKYHYFSPIIRDSTIIIKSHTVVKFLPSRLIWKELVFLRMAHCNSADIFKPDQRNPQQVSKNSWN